jgi:hypothetical protein
MTAGSESSEDMSSASMILIVDADSVKRGNFTDEILIAGAGSGKVGSSMIEAGDMSAARAVGGNTEEGKSTVG